VTNYVTEKKMFYQMMFVYNTSTRHGIWTPCQSERLLLQIFRPSSPKHKNRFEWVSRPCFTRRRNRPISSEKLKSTALQLQRPLRISIRYFLASLWTEKYFSKELASSDDCLSQSTDAIAVRLGQLTLILLMAERWMRRYLRGFSKVNATKHNWTSRPTDHHFCSVFMSPKFIWSEDRSYILGFSWSSSSPLSRWWIIT
jgi:hypothetical protein